ncbi:metalloregulator ArsR/SmtB family transcription factor [Nesterenkonia sp. CL21]|uniref:ArsR/SmtB family transcription factor n=1 Tax=Nesterenkonia sp. CL21 TaxID=3064894 RepID=UPI0028784794|nr:metalloregulator ArsR/SmtB family transcription factor [Nesterenkonia sp. CL21]MDS2171879.1 metalloregulator ArsR/SmtB family transcription factor [Nesterenkonia sp. CL21]
MTASSERSGGESSRIDDTLWDAVGDPTRRALMDVMIAAGPSSATRLSEQMPVSRQAVAKHLAVLERAGLVEARQEGRERRFTVDPEQLSRATAQLQDVGRRWDARLDRIRLLAEEIHRSRAN